MELSFSDRFEILSAALSSFWVGHYALIIAAAIGFGTVFFTILINHGVRLRRIKLIHGFTSTFSPERRKSDLVGSQSRAAVRGSSRTETDIRYSPSLEFVVGKYITDLDEALSPDEFKKMEEFVRLGEGAATLVRDRSTRTGGTAIEYMLHGVGCFSMPVNRRMLFNALPAMVVIAAGWYLILQAFRVLAPHFWIVPKASPICPVGCSSYLVPLAIVFFSAYVASLKILIRAVSLFDLTSITFLRVFLHIVASMLAGYIIWAAFLAGDCCQTPVRSILAYPILFVIGFVPDGGINTLLSHIATAAQQPQSKETAQRSSRVDVAGDTLRYIGSVIATLTQFVKLTDGRFSRVTKSVPLDAIDGIDFFTRYRLEEAGIYEVQNLATANPILLHVETPFGIYQTIDWVGQAQLCTVVGIERFLIFRQLNIRTVFDLERAVLSLKATSAIRRIVGGILLMPTNVLTEIEGLGVAGGRFPDFRQTGAAEDRETPQAEPTGRGGPDAKPAAGQAAGSDVATHDDREAKDDGSADEKDAGKDQHDRGFFSAIEYCRWAAAEALKPARYRLTLPRARQAATEPENRRSGGYRVYPIELPTDLKLYAKFEVVDGDNSEPLDLYQVDNELDATIKHAVRLIMDDLHVMRLRQVWESLARILGTDAATLDDSEDTFLGA